MLHQLISQEPWKRQISLNHILNLKTLIKKLKSIDKEILTELVTQEYLEQLQLACQVSDLLSMELVVQVQKLMEIQI